MAGAITTTPTEGSPDALRRAHAALLQQTDIQFSFQPFVPPQPPAWLRAMAHWLKPLADLIGRGMIAIAPAFKFIFWGGLIAGAAVIGYFLVSDLLGVRFAWRPRKPARAVQLEPAWKPGAAVARVLLEDADRLAAEGRFDEATHLLLFRSIQDIDARWPNTVRPALTSRDIAAHPKLSDAARATFAGIAQVVERSVFGQAHLGADDFKACREAYAAFALPAAS